jgi:hypothetical protein
MTNRFVFKSMGTYDENGEKNVTSANRPAADWRKYLK